MQQTICDLCKKLIVAADDKTTLSVVHPPDANITFDYHSTAQSPCWEMVSAAITSASPPPSPGTASPGAAPATAG